MPDAAVNARAYDGVAIECSKIAYKPGMCCLCPSVSEGRVWGLVGSKQLHVNDQVGYC